MRLVEIEEVNDVLNRLLSALNCVEEKYYIMNYGSPDLRRNQKPERSFVAELYHQLRTNQANEFDNLMFNIDLIKFIGGNGDNIENICLPSLNHHKISPDLVFHESQSSLDSQKLICEVKTDNQSWISITKDLYKLLFYKLSFLKYDNAVFVYVGIKEDFERKVLFKIRRNANLSGCLMKNKIVFAVKTSNEYNSWKLYQLFND